MQRLNSKVVMYLCSLLFALSCSPREENIILTTQVSQVVAFIENQIVTSNFKQD